MKKILLPLVALMLSATAANAQVKVVDSSKFSSKMNVAQSQTSFVGGLKSTTLNTTGKAMAPSKKKAEDGLESNQRYVGNSNALNPYTAVGLPGQKATKAGVLLFSDVLAKYAGDRIIGFRFALNSSIGNTHVMLQEYTGYDENTGMLNVTDELASADVAETTAADQNGYNWNIVKFDKPYTIPSTPKDILFGMTYTQKSTQESGEYTSDCYPFIVSYGGTPGGFCLYTTLNNNTGWYPLSLSKNLWCDMMAQVIVEREGGFIEDIELSKLVSDHFVNKGGSFNFTMYGCNSGSKSISNYVFGLACDGKEIGTIPGNQTLTNDETTFNVNGAQLPSTTEVGPHLMSVYVKSMNGAAPTGDLSNDTLYSVVRVHNNEYIPHQKQLIEHFTSQACVYCPNGYDILNHMSATRNDLAWVAVHNYLSGNDDDYVYQDGAYITSYSTTGFPSASFNRYYKIDDNTNPNRELAMSIGYSDSDRSASTYFSNVVDESDKSVPAFVRLDLTQECDNSGYLNLTVTGTGVKDAAKILNGARLTVYLTEDGLVGTQKYMQSTIQEYKHDHVLRMILSAVGGDQIQWNGDNFSMAYEAEIPEDYDFSKMHAVAFINNPFVEFSSDGKQYGFYKDNSDAWVSNCNMIAIEEGKTNGISNTVASENKTVVARYAVDGTQLSAPVKGVNIVKYSDGTTKSVIVK